MTSRRKRPGANEESQQGLVVNGWTILAHPCFLDQLEKLIDTVQREQAKAPTVVTDNQKLLSQILDIAFEAIPRDPAHREYRQGHTLGSERSHWFRAKFGGGRFRLFFRFRSDARMIVLAWVNDETSLRTYGSSTDAYAVFRRMLDAGKPPDSWDELVAAGKKANKRLAGVAPKRKSQGRRS